MSTPAILHALATGRLPPASIRRVHALLLLSAIVGFGMLSARYGPDANWDLRNYHLYGPWAWLNGRLGYDLAPAQLQTFLNPTLDLPYWWLLGELNDRRRVLQAVLAIPQAVAVFLAFAIIARLAEARSLAGILASAALALFGASGAAGLPTLGTTMSEMIPACLMLAGMLILLRSAGAPRAVTAVATAGLLLGAACGLKLTFAVYAIGAAAGVLLAHGATLRAGIFRVAVFCTAVGLMLGMTMAPWAATLQAHYGSPLFPFYNDLFRSDWLPPVRLADERFLPHGLLDAMTLPFRWACFATTRVSELTMRDPRFALAWVGLLAAVLAHVARLVRLRRADVLFLIFFATSFAVWSVQFGIFRYLAPLELLTGAALLLGLRPLFALPRGGALAAAGFVALALVTERMTVRPDWGRALRSPLAVALTPPPLEPDSLVVLLQDAPMAYVAPFAPPSVRWVGASTNLVRPSDSSRLAQAIAAAIASHAGPIYGFDIPSEPSRADEVLQHHGLRREACGTVPSNLDGAAIRWCRLTRAP